MGALKGYVTRNNRYVEAKNKLVNNVENFYKGREKIIKGFENKVFPLYYNEAYEYQLKAQKEAEEEEKEEKRRKRRAKKGEQEEIFPTEFDNEAIQEEQDKKTPSPPSPYEYISNFYKFKEQLPSKEKFYSSLTGKQIRDKEYQYALIVWNKFEMKTIENYHDLN